MELRSLANALLPSRVPVFILVSMAGEPHFYPLVLARSRELAAVFASLETALTRLEATIKDPALLAVFRTAPVFPEP